MRAYTYRFEKVLTFREQEKTETEIEFKLSVKEFETVATNLFELLKKKEDIQYEQQGRMEKGQPIDDMVHFARYVTSLEKRITEVQQKVIQARLKMNWYEEKLIEKTIEVRKFEKMRENDKEDYRQEMAQLESKQLDELSTLTFGSREFNR